MWQACVIGAHSVLQTAATICEHYGHFVSFPLVKNWVELDIVSIFWGIEFQVFFHDCLSLKLSDEFRGVCDWFERVQKHGLGFLGWVT
jgi:hypothetical protein